MFTTILLAALVAASAPLPDIPPLLQPVLWVVVGLVLMFGINAALAWLNADRAKQTNPVIKEAEGQVVDLLQQLKSTLGPNGANTSQVTSQIAPMVQAALDAAFHSHTVATGAPHPDDPRAPK